MYSTCDLTTCSNLLPLASSPLPPLPPPLPPSLPPSQPPPLPPPPLPPPPQITSGFKPPRLNEGYEELSAIRPLMPPSITCDQVHVHTFIRTCTHVHTERTIAELSAIRPLMPPSITCD